MALSHHDGQNYTTATSTAAKTFGDKLERTIEANHPTVMNLIQKVDSEVPKDYLALTTKLDFSADDKGLIVQGPGNFGAQRVHGFALGQIAEHAGIPSSWVREMSSRPEQWARDLMAKNLAEVFAHEKADQRLLRSVNGEVRGFLSDRFRRIDSRPVIEAFATSARGIGAQFLEGHVGDTRIALKAVLPMVFEPVEGEVLAFGLSLSNSDFGNGALSLKAFILRLACLNGMTVEEALRAVHLGRRLTQEVVWAEDTIQADTATMVKMLRDTVQAALSPGKVGEMMALIGRANEAKIDPRKAIAELKAKGLTKGEVDATREVYMNGGIAEVPRGDTTYRLSNALSWIAKSAESTERRLELEQMAGTMLLQAA